MKNIALNDWQYGQIGSFIDELQDLDEMGEPGMLIAQIWVDRETRKAWMQVTVLGPEESRAVQAAVGTTPGAEGGLGEEVWVNVP